MSDHRGKFVWYELMTPDTAAATAFYTNVVGWTARDAEMPGMDYTLLSAGETQIAGILNVPGAPPMWVGFIAVESVDETAERFAKAGGVVHHAPTDIPGIGRYAVLADPQGIMIALFSSEGAPTPYSMAPGHVGWHELVAVDGAAALDFYGTEFGWKQVGEFDMGPMGPYRLFAAGEDRIGGIMTKPPSTPHPGWRYYISVQAIDAAMARVTEGGGKILNGPHQVPGGTWVVQAEDPQGAAFNLLSDKR